MRNALVAVAGALLAACNNAPTGDEPSGPVGAGGPVGEDAANAVQPQLQDSGDLPQQTEALRLVGKWAPDHRSCQSAPWQFTSTTLKTPAGASCSFNRVEAAGSGYNIEATCTAEASPMSDTLKIRFIEKGKAMLLDSNTVGAERLIFCGRDV